ncbi:MAG: hypothetical protein AAF432_12255 [Planctomycetota bacterium]
MKKRYVVLELASGRADLARFEGSRRAAQCRLDWTTATDTREWIEDAHTFGTALKNAVESIDAVGLRVHVLYRSPSQTVDLEGMSIKNEPTAVDAARLHGLDSLSFTDASPLVEAALVARDRDGENRRCHAIVAGDRDDISEAIVRMVTDAGLEFDTATPTDALVFSKLVRDTVRTSDPAAGLLYLGDESSFFVCGGKGQVFIGRRIGLGYESLVTPLTRPIRTGDGTSIELTRDAARAIILEHGIPDFKAVIDHDPPLQGRQIVPLLQPVLQRLVVEVRQSLRFGLPSDGPREVPITLCGPGAMVPELARVLGEELAQPVVVDDAVRDFKPEMPASRSSVMMDSLKAIDVADELNLQPTTLASSRRSRQLKRWLWIGGAAAVVVMSFEAVINEMSLRQIRGQATVIEAQQADIDSFVETRNRLADGLTAMNQLNTLINDQIAIRPMYGAVLAELSAQAGDQVQFITINLQDEDGTTSGQVTGYCMHADTQDAAAPIALEPFVDRLRQSPLFENVTLGSVQAGNWGSRDAQRFELTLDIVRVPTKELLAASTTSDEGTMP